MDPSETSLFPHLLLLSPPSRISGEVDSYKFLTSIIFRTLLLLLLFKERKSWVGGLVAGEV